MSWLDLLLAAGGTGASRAAGCKQWQEACTGASPAAGSHAAAVSRGPGTLEAAHLGTRGGVVAQESVEHGGGHLGGACGRGKGRVRAQATRAYTMAAQLLQRGGHPRACPRIVRPTGVKPAWGTAPLYPLVPAPSLTIGAGIPQNARHTPVVARLPGLHAIAAGDVHTRHVGADCGAARRAEDPVAASCKHDSKVLPAVGRTACCCCCSINPPGCCCSNPLDAFMSMPGPLTGVGAGAGAGGGPKGGIDPVGMGQASVAAVREHAAAAHCTAHRLLPLSLDSSLRCKVASELHSAAGTAQNSAAQRAKQPPTPPSPIQPASCTQPIAHRGATDSTALFRDLGRAGPNTTAELEASGAEQFASFWGGCQQKPSVRFLISPTSNTCEVESIATRVGVGLR